MEASVPTAQKWLVWEEGVWISCAPLWYQLPEALTAFLNEARPALTVEGSSCASRLFIWCSEDALFNLSQRRETLYNVENYSCLCSVWLEYKGSLLPVDKPAPNSGSAEQFPGVTSRGHWWSTCATLAVCRVSLPDQACLEQHLVSCGCAQGRLPITCTKLAGLRMVCSYGCNHPVVTGRWDFASGLGCCESLVFLIKGAR